MADRPILFSGPMVRALLVGAKTQTRRTLKNCNIVAREPQWEPKKGAAGVWRLEADTPELSGRIAPDVPIAIGDRLYVREAWRCNGWATDVATIMYRASGGDGYTAMTEQYPVDGKKPTRVTGTWRPGIHMPRWASRLTLTVTDVRVERLQDISDRGPQNDCTDEGVFHSGMPVPSYEEWHGSGLGSSEKYMYRQLWEAINGPGSWNANPWVAAYTFVVALSNIDLRARAV